LKKTSIGIIIGLMSFALVGVVAMQLYFLRQSYNMESKSFDRSVNEALNTVVDKLTKQDANNFLKEQAKHAIESKPKNKPRYFEVADKSGDTRELIYDSAKIKKNQTARERQLAVLRDSLQRIILNQKLDEELLGANIQLLFEQYTDEFGDVHLRATPRIIKYPNPHRKIYKYDTTYYRYSDPQFGNQVTIRREINPLWRTEQARKQKEKQISQVKQMLTVDSIQNDLHAGKSTAMQSLMEEYQKTNEPLTKRIDFLIIDSLLRIELINKGITVPFNYVVSTANTDSVIFSNAVNSNTKKPPFVETAYKVPIFGKEVINDPGLLTVYFPKKNSLILSKMTTTMGITAGLLFILIICFAYTLFSIIRQKKISEMKTDFINNMTHEFKTPVSTIMIASESLRYN